MRPEQEAEPEAARNEIMEREREERGSEWRTGGRVEEMEGKLKPTEMIMKRERSETKPTEKRRSGERAHGEGVLDRSVPASPVPSPPAAVCARAAWFCVVLC
jgi:hypothetical protein